MSTGTTVSHHPAPQLHQLCNSCGVSRSCSRKETPQNQTSSSLWWGVLQGQKLSTSTEGKTCEEWLFWACLNSESRRWAQKIPALWLSLARSQRWEIWCHPDVRTWMWYINMAMYWLYPCGLGSLPFAGDAWGPVPPHNKPADEAWGQDSYTFEDMLADMPR